jgi:predicted HTH transcriptional regulator
MNRPDYLGAAILTELELRGPMTTPWLAQNLGESLRAIASSCVSLARASKIRSYKTGNFYKALCGKKTAEVFWELGAADCPPPRPVRKRHSVEPCRPVGIDDADLEWMEKYRQQAAQRRNRVEVRF